VSGMSEITEAKSLPLTREVDFAKQKTEGEKKSECADRFGISPSVSHAPDSSLVRGSRDWRDPMRKCILLCKKQTPAGLTFRCVLGLRVIPCKTCLIGDILTTKSYSKNI